MSNVVNESDITALIKSGYRDLEKFKVDIESDPVKKGFSNVSEKVALIRSYLNQVEVMYLQAVKIRSYRHARFLEKDQYIKIILPEMKNAVPKFVDKIDQVLVKSKDSSAESTYKEVKTKAIMYNEERESVAKEKMKKDYEELGVLEILYNEAKVYVETIKFVFDNLLETKMDLLTQMGVIKSQMFIGEIPINREVVNGFTQFSIKQEDKHTSGTKSFDI